MESGLSESLTNNYITKHDVNCVLSNYLNTNDFVVEKYFIKQASAQMLGFLSDYWKLQVEIVPNKQFFFFIKAISRLNLAKADMVKELKMFERELCFYDKIRKLLEISGIKPWSPRLVAILNEAMVFEDLGALKYTLRSKLKRFDMAHTLQSLDALARFHCSTIIYEEKKSKEIGCCYNLNEEFKSYLGEAGYHENSPWFLQCMEGALEAIKKFSKYEKTIMDLVESRWRTIWLSALRLSSSSLKYRNVICHRDLWNNNLLFKYSETEVPIDCVFVDFQAIRYQPPSSDVMLLLCCNLDPKFRAESLETFLNFYYEKLYQLSLEHNIKLENVISKQDFLSSANEQKLWGLVACACLMPVFWIDEDILTENFCDAAQFDEILSKNKAAFILNMMNHNQNYKDTVMEIFEEIVNNYCLISPN